MLYTLFVFTFGVYVGQEYRDVPNVRLTVNNAMKYLKDKNAEPESESESSSSESTARGVAGTEGVPKSAIEFWKSFFEKPKNE